MSPRRGLVRSTLTYLRRDLREIVAPTSLPDGDDGDDFTASNGGNGDDADRKHRRNRLGSRLRAVASGIQDYCDTWKKGSEPWSVEAEQSTSEKARLEGNDFDDDDAAAAAADRLETDAALREAASDARDALASASRAGAEALRPALRQLYRTRAAAYRDAVFSFVEGYREGLAGGSGSGGGGGERAKDEEGEEEEEEEEGKRRKE